ncbi:MFS transporter [Solicola gregarius]|uniref:MFS transporter n=1 Tax=Solicola gregarius TaxID=2908642 RepID=A0AA46TNN6_9ACTN|nr:MFS transporter [Solicola gregarius]UYM07718.1 MFS transporter [Solicola gregarius]
MTEPTTATRVGAATHPRATLALTAAATFLVLMDYTAPLTTIPDLASALDASAAEQTWLINSMPLGLAALLLVSGGLADDYGRRRLFVVGAVALAVSLACAAVAPGSVTFILARVVQGAAGAAVLATSLALIAEAYDGSARVHALGIWGASVGAGIAVGPLASGVFGAAHWAGPYWLFAVAAAALAAVAVPTLTESRTPNPGRPDLIGALTLGIGLALLLGALTEGRSGWASPSVLALFAGAAVLIAAFAVSQARVRRPLVDPALFRHPPFLASTIGALVTGMAIIGMMSYLPTVLQLDAGFAAMATAGLFVFWSGTSAAVAYYSRRLNLRPAPQLAAGFVVAALGPLSWLGGLGSDDWLRLVPGLVVAGAGSGLVNAALPRLAVESVPAQRTAMGSGANNTARYVGSSIGVAVVIAIVQRVADGGGANDLAHGMDVAIIVTSVIALLGAAFTYVLVRD